MTHAEKEQRVQRIKAEARKLGWTPQLVAELTAIRAGYLDPPDPEKLFVSACARAVRDSLDEIDRPYRRADYTQPAPPPGWKSQHED